MSAVKEMSLPSSIKVEKLESALRGLLELVEDYSPREQPNGERYLPANGGHGIEREIRIARETLADAQEER